MSTTAPVITGSFIQESVDIDSWDGSRWDTELSNGDAVGIKQWILQWTADQDDMACLYPAPWPASVGAMTGYSWSTNADYCDNLIYWAGQLNHTVWLGLANFGAWQQHATDASWLSVQQTLMRQVADQLYTAYSGYAPFIGFYIPFEVDSVLLSTPAAITPMTDFFTSLINYLHTTYPSKKVMLSPTYSYTGLALDPRAFASALASVLAGADVIAMQDGGANQTTTTIAAYFSALASELSTTTTKLWSNADMFNDSFNAPQPITYLESNLRAAAPYVDGFVGFSFTTQMGPNDLSSSNTYDAYSTYVGQDPQQIPKPAYQGWGTPL